MREVLMLRGSEPQRVLRSIVEKQLPATMCYLSRGKWHIAKIQALGVDSRELMVDILPPGYSNQRQSKNSNYKPRPINIKLGQPVGVSVKCEGGKFIFETKVVDFSFSSQSESGGILILEVPAEIEMVSRRSYFRVQVPEKLEVGIEMWHRKGRAKQMENERKWQGRLVDLSAGGLQVAIRESEKPEFREGQFVKICFSPLPSDAPIEFSAQIRNILPTADGQFLCFGLQIVGLEASEKGRKTLSRIVGVTELYYDLNKPRESTFHNSKPDFRASTLAKRYHSEWGHLLRP